jgi:hypothetical protein
VRDNAASQIVGETVELDLSGAVAGPLATWQDVERLGLALMRALGFDDARLTPPGADAGIDIDSRNGVCQVKHWTNQVGRREVQQTRWGGGWTAGRVPRGSLHEPGDRLGELVRHGLVRVRRYDVGTHVQLASGGARCSEGAARADRP